MKKLILSGLIVFSALSSYAATDKGSAQTVDLAVTEKGFEPDSIKVKPGTHVILKITRKTDSTCATEIKFKEKKITKTLPLNKEVLVDVGTVQKGNITFACGMNMITGHIVVE